MLNNELNNETRPTKFVFVACKYVCSGYHSSWWQWVRSPSFKGDNLVLTCPWARQWISISSVYDLWPTLVFLPLAVASTFSQFSHSPLSWITLPSFSPPCLTFLKCARVCQSHFKSVSCFNLLNLFFPQPLHLISSPTPSYTLLICCRHPHGSWNVTNHVILYFVLSTISLSFPPRSFLLMFPPSLLSCRLISQFWAQVRKRIIFL